MNNFILFLLNLSLIFPQIAQSQVHSDTLGGDSSIFNREIPKLKNGGPPTYYLNKPSVERMIGLPSLEHGFDSLQLRIWYGYARRDSSQLVVISRHKKIWSAQLYAFIYVTKGDNKKIQAINKTIRPGYPKSGWIHLTDSLFALSITTLPDQSTIDNYPEFADGNSVIVEVATIKSYRIYSYKEPDQAKSQIKQAATMEQILTLIENQFGFVCPMKF